jgi:double zinc ribbon protein
MTCPSCGHENPGGARFCNACGKTLEGLCPRCGKPNPAGSRFCNNCGGSLQAAGIAELVADPRSYTPKHLAEKILTSRSALEGERKQVTVLFADVKGSMNLAEQVDPGKWHGILDRFFQILSDGVHRCEGTIKSDFAARPQKELEEGPCGSSSSAAASAASRRHWPCGDSPSRI